MELLYFPERENSFQSNSNYHYYMENVSKEVFQQECKPTVHYNICQ